MRIVELPDVVEFESKDVNEKHVHSVVIMKKVPAVPLRFSALSRAAGIPDWDDPGWFSNIHHNPSGNHGELPLAAAG